MERLLKSSVKVSVLTLLALPLSYLIRLALSKNLTLADFGFFYAIIGFFDLLQATNDFGFSEAQVYFLPKFLVKKRLDKIKAAIKAQLAIQVVTTILIGAVINHFAPFIADKIFHYPQAENIIRIMVIYFIAKDFLLNTRNLFFSFQEIKIFAPQEIVRISITATLILGSWYIGDFNLLVVSWVWIGVYLLLAIVYFYLFLTRHKEILKAKKYSMKRIYKEFIPFLLPTFLSNNAGVLFSSGTETLLAFFRGVTEVGIFNIAKPISNLALAVVNPVASLIKPFISQISEEKEEGKVKELIKLIINVGPFLLLPLVLTLVIYAKESIDFLFGIEFLEATTTLRLVSINVFFLVMSSFVFGILFGLGLQKRKVVLVYFASAISVVLSLILIPRYGSSGVAMANLGYTAIMVFGALIVIRREIKFSYPVSNYIKIILLSLLFVLTQYIFSLYNVEGRASQFALFVGKIGLGLGIYYLLGVFVFKIVDFSVLKKTFLLALPKNLRKSK